MKKAYKIFSAYLHKKLDEIHIVKVTIYLQDELCCYVSRVEERSVAMENGKLTIFKEQTLPEVGV